MQLKSLSLACTLMLLATSFTQLNAQYEKSDSTYKKCFVGSTFFMLGNFSKTNKPDFAQLNLGYRLTGRDVVSVELKTWKYAWSLGIPFGGSSFEAPEEEFPGYVREFGFALAYQRYVWKNFYTAVHVMNAWQSFVNTEGNKIDNGFQLFNTYRLGYHIKLFKDRAFLEPSVAVTQRVYHTDMPDSFRAFHYKGGKFNWEPRLHFGVNL